MRNRLPILITGGAGFIGTNLADRLASEGLRVRIFDNLSRPGVERNLQWLLARHGSSIEFRQEDVRNASEVARAVQGVGMVYHFAAQVAVTTSLVSPVEDFEINVRGTLNVLEAIRVQATPPGILFTSTNKVYGSLDDLRLREGKVRYEAVDDRPIAIAETRELDFHSPYGCSKGAADQYVKDFARSYRIPSVVFRMSCIYGPHQFGTEDQGWVAHFLIQALKDEPIAIYGNGKQVRDILHVDDLVDAMQCVRRRLPELAGHVFNIGGGWDNSVSLVQVLHLIEQFHGTSPELRFDAVRQGDQRYYVSDTSEFTRFTGWRPRRNVRDGVDALRSWILENRIAARNANERAIAA